MVLKRTAELTQSLPGISGFRFPHSSALSSCMWRDAAAQSGLAEEYWALSSENKNCSSLKSCSWPDMCKLAWSHTRSSGVNFSCTSGFRYRENPLSHSSCSILLLPGLYSPAVQATMLTSSNQLNISVLNFELPYVMCCYTWLHYFLLQTFGVCCKGHMS